MRGYIGGQAWRQGAKYAEAIMKKAKGVSAAAWFYSQPGFRNNARDEEPPPPVHNHPADGHFYPDCARCALGG